MFLWLVTLSFISASARRTSSSSSSSWYRYQSGPRYTRNVQILRQSDFEQGTYRITTPGHYQLGESIVFNPNAGQANEPNAWLPKYPQQMQDYPPNAYRLGFFAAITIECPDVVLDLRGHSLSMSRAFYLQQRFGTLISLASTPFITGKGPADFGEIQSASNCVIRNGKLGLTSHHGIQGNNVDTCVIEDLDIHDFEVGGIALNNVRNIQIRHVHISDSVRIPFSGDYSGARFLVRFYRQIFTQSELNNNQITFHDGRTYTLQQILDRLVYSMDLMFRYFVHHEGPFNSDPAWGEFFASDTDLPDGSALYGMNINGFGPAVNGLGAADVTSENVDIYDVRIYGLRVAPKERVKFFQNVVGQDYGIAAVGVTGDSFDVARASNNKFADPSTAVYVGTRLTDAQIALDKFAPADSFVRHTLSIPPVIRDWALRGTPIPSHSFTLACNGDTQFHVQKGLIGLRIDSTTRFSLKDVTIAHLKNTGDFGSTKCGPYTADSIGAHPDQELDGYRGTTSLGMSVFAASGRMKDVKIFNVKSAKGISYGMYVHDASVSFHGRNRIRRVIAEGLGFPEEQNGVPLPNLLPQACGVYLNGDSVSVRKSRKMRVTCVSGMSMCSPSGTIVGTVLPCPN